MSEGLNGYGSCVELNFAKLLVFEKVIEGGKSPFPSVFNRCHGMLKDQLLYWFVHASSFLHKKLVGRDLDYLAVHGPTVGEGERNLFAEVAVKETELLDGRYVVFLLGFSLGCHSCPPLGSSSLLACLCSSLRSRGKWFRL